MCEQEHYIQISYREKELGILFCIWQRIREMGNISNRPAGQTFGQSCRSSHAHAQGSHAHHASVGPTRTTNIIISSTAFPSSTQILQHSSSHSHIICLTSHSHRILALESPTTTGLPSATISNSLTNFPPIFSSQLHAPASPSSSPMTPLTQGWTTDDGATTSHTRSCNRRTEGLQPASRELQLEDGGATTDHTGSCNRRTEELQAGSYDR